MTLHAAYTDSRIRQNSDSRIFPFSFFRGGIFYANYIFQFGKHDRERESATVCVVSEAAAMQTSETKAGKDDAATEFIR